jgi:glycogen operon protein
MVLDAGNDVTYLFKKTDGISDLTADDRCIWFLIDGSAVGDHDFLVLINMYHLPVDFRLPSPSNNYRWLRIIDTAAWAETDYNCWSVDQGTVIADNYKVNGFSIVVCEEIN